MEHLLTLSKIYGIRQMQTLYSVFYSFGKLIGEKIMYFNIYIYIYILKAVELILFPYFSQIIYIIMIRSIQELIIDGFFKIVFEPYDVEIDAFRKR